MTSRQLKAGCFVLEGLNSFATSFYFYYLFFYMQRQFGFGNQENLALAALNGLIYALMAWLAGLFGQRYGYFKALALGFATMAIALVVGAGVPSAMGQVCVLAAWTVGICFTWPNLEALASEKENAVGLQKMIGIYNLVWAGTGALAYFIGGIFLEWLGLKSLFWIPAAIHLLQLALLAWLWAASGGGVSGPAVPVTSSVAVALNPRPIGRARSFLRMAWLANPFAYVAINTVAAVVPGLAAKLNLSPALAGVFCSVWFFARLGAFLLLWLWTGWHYRLGWFFGSYLLLISSFATLLLVPNLTAIVLAQIAFGAAIGLIYYSSLYYSMDVGEAKGEHGGVHEAAIGAGIFGGPAIGASALYLFPGSPNSGVWAVSIALCAGLAGLIAMARRQVQSTPSPK